MKAGRAKCGIIGDCQKVLLCAVLSESSRIKLDKAGKTADLQRSKTVDISSRKRSPGKVDNTGIQVFAFARPVTLLLLCQNYMTLCVRIGKIDRLRPPLNA